MSRRRLPERVLLSRLRVNMSARLALSDESPAVEAPEHTDPAELAAGDPRHDASGFEQLSYGEQPVCTTWASLAPDGV